MPTVPYCGSDRWPRAAARAEAWLPRGLAATPGNCYTLLSPCNEEVSTESR